MVRRVKKIFLFLLIFIATERFCRWQTEGFEVRKIMSELTFNPKMETTPLNSQEQISVERILDQPFYFLGSGAQFYAFSSEDGQSVIKFIKHNRCRKNPEKLNQIMQSCHIASENLKSETGLIYAHLNKTSHWKKRLTLVDKINIRHDIDLDSTEFLLQKKATLFCDEAKKNPASIEKLVDAMIQLVTERCQKGFANLDPMLERNFGVIDGQVIDIDIGALMPNARLKKTHGYKREVFLELLPLRDWIKEKHPQFLGQFDEKIKTILNS